MTGELVDIDTQVARIRSGSRAHIARAITLVESTRPDHREQAHQLLQALMPFAGTSQRIGVSGVPGVGKSTFIDAFGMHLVEQGHRVAVLAVDPSSNRTGGSILGDRTRMARLGVHDSAFVRPSPTAGVLGGVARATREAIVVMEAAGYDVVIVETVGVGQSEVAVANMVDCFLLLSIARTGDQLQGIKRGILELADVIAVNKADGPHEREAGSAARELASALRLMEAADAEWSVPVLTCSGLAGTGLDEVWAAITQHREVRVGSGAFAANRAQQQVDWTWSMVTDQLLDSFRSDSAVRLAANELEPRLRDGSVTPSVAVSQLLHAFRP